MSNMAMNSWSIVFFLIPHSRALQYIFPFNFTVTPDCQCSLYVDPVCGRSGPVQYTYMNKCVLDCSKKSGKYIELLYYGECCQEKICSPFSSPVCDYTGRMHLSPCNFDNAQCVELRYKGRHLSMDSTHVKCSCIKPCETSWDPVCDNNGQTYPNRCVFENAKCYFKMEYNETISIDYAGTCCDNMCSPARIYYQSLGHSTEAVCDSENITHSDLCSFYTRQCQVARRSQGKKKIRVTSIGPCSRLPADIKDTFHYFIQRFPTK